MKTTKNKKRVYFYMLSIITAFFFAGTWPTFKRWEEGSFIVKWILAWFICLIISAFSSAFSLGLFRGNVIGHKEIENFEELIGTGFFVLLIISIFLGGD